MADDMMLYVATGVVALIVLVAITQMSSKPAKAFTEEELAAEAPKKKQKKKQAAPAPAPAPKKKKKKGSTSVLGMLDDKEEKAEKKAAKKKSKKAAAKPAAAAPSKPIAPSAAPVVLKQSEIDDGWGVVVSNKKSKKGGGQKKAPAPAPAPTHASALAAYGGAPAPAPAMSAKSGDLPDSAEVRVDGRKLGVIIGPGGATIKAIQESTGCRIETPDRDKGEEMASGPVIITVFGTAQSVKLGKKAIEDLSSKGYSAVLEGNNFSEGAISCPIAQMSELIGARGVICKAIQENCEVRLNFPDTKNMPMDNFGRPKKSTVKVGIAGEKTKVQKAKQIMKEILKFHHHPVTHPGITHVELDVPPSLYSIVIGPKGSAIKHIQNSFFVKVNIPRDDSNQENILVVGAPADCTRAKAAIDKMIEKATAEPEEEEWVDEGYDDRYDDEGPHEAWMDQYKPPPRRSGWQ